MSFNFLRKSCISLCRTRENILFNFAPKSPVCALLLIPILISDSCFARLYACFIFSPSKFHLFSFKDKIPKALRSCVVYSFKCRCCSASYLGQTVRHLPTRVSEHLGFSALTGRKSCSPVMSSILSHLNSTGHTASLDDFQILSSCSSPDELLVRESLLISKYKPSLNIQGSSVPLLLL